MGILTIIALLFTGYWLLLLLLCIYKWDWLSEHPELYKRRRGDDEYRTAKYDGDIRKNVRNKSLLFMVIGIILVGFFVNRYINVMRLEDYDTVRAGQAVPLAGGQLVLEDWVAESEFTISTRNLETGEYEEVTIKGDSRMDVALLAFTGILTNNSEENMVIYHDDIKMMGVPEDVGQGNQLVGYWLADGNMDMDGAANLAPGETANVYFWTLVTEEQMQLPYAIVIHDGENYYKVDMSSL